jgi:UPF0716 protein FxsA
MNLTLLVLLLPVAEIWLLVQVGSHIGAGWTVLLVVAGALGGLLVIQTQGLSGLARMTSLFRPGVSPAREMLDRLLVLFAGVLLLIPGFITDVAGLALLLPPLRRWVSQRLLRRMVMVAPGAAGATPPENTGQPRVLEGESRRIKD